MYLLLKLFAVNNEICKILPKESLRVVVGVDVDLCERVVSCRLVTAFVNSRLEPGKNQLKTISLLDLFNQLVSAELASDNLD